MRKIKWQWPIMIAALVLGLMVTFQYKATQQIKEEANNSTRRFATFLKVLNKAEDKRSSLEREVVNLRDEIKSYRNGAAKSPVADNLSKKVDRLRVITGEVSVEGPGVILTLDDRNSRGTSVYSSDIKDILNILRYGGAEAIAINGQRVVTNTAVHEAGRNLLVNKVPINREGEVPYEIMAIGDKGQLENYLKVTYGLLNDLEAGGVTINITTQERLVIPAYKGGTSFKLAKPVG